MDPQILAFVLLLAGIALIFAELFLPSGGMIAVMCVGCFAGSVYFAHDAWRDSYPVYWWSYVSVVAVLIPASIFGAFYTLTNTSLGDRVLLRSPKAEEVTPYQEEIRELQKLIGKRGVALNLMTPGGLVSVNGERLHASADGLMVEQHAEIEVVEIRGTRIIVRAVDPHAENETSVPSDVDESLADSSSDTPPVTESPSADIPADPWINENDDVS